MWMCSLSSFLIWQTELASLIQIFLIAIATTFAGHAGPDVLWVGIMEVVGNLSWSCLSSKVELEARLGCGMRRGKRM